MSDEVNRAVRVIKAFTAGLQSEDPQVKLRAIEFGNRLIPRLAEIAEERNPATYDEAFDILLQWAERVLELSPEPTDTSDKASGGSAG